jgi:hypothetical protein
LDAAEDTDLPLTGISVSDVDIGSGNIAVMLTVEHSTTTSIRTSRAGSTLPTSPTMTPPP